MNHDEFAFVNQQLAAMLREGIPLEGALRKLCAESKRGRPRIAFSKIESDLRRGVPLEKAISSSSLPEFYREMVRLGAASGDLPGVLTLAADHYRRVGAIWTRLRALLTYPFLVLLVSLALSIWFAITTRDSNAALIHEIQQPRTPLMRAFNLNAPDELRVDRSHWRLNLWVPPALMTLAILLLVFIFSAPLLRARLRWRLPPFKEASMAQLASTLHILLRKGLPLRESL